MSEKPKSISQISESVYARSKGQSGHVFVSKLIDNIYAERKRSKGSRDDSNRGRNRKNSDDPER